MAKAYPHTSYTIGRRHMARSHDTSIRVDRTTHRLVEEFREKSETMADAIRRAIVSARTAEA